MRKLGLKRFGGLKTVVNPRLIGKQYASAGRDFKVDKGDLDWRSGWDQLYAGAIGSWTASFGLYFARAISSLGVVTDEYLSFEQVGATTKLYVRHVDTGAPTEVTKAGPTSQTLDNSEWGMWSWRDKVYIFNENDSTVPLAEYTPGDIDSLVIIVRPNPPETGDELTYTVTTPRTALDWSAALAGDFTGTGAFAAAQNISSYIFQIRHDGTTGSTTFTFDIGNTVGQQDHGYTDVLEITARYATDPSTHGFRVDYSSFKFIPINGDGTPVEFELEILRRTGGIGTSVAWFLRYPPDSDRALRDNIDKIRVEYTVESASSDPTNFDVLQFEGYNTGGCDVSGAEGYDYLDVAYVYKISSSGTTSTLGPVTRISMESLRGVPWPHDPSFTFGYKLDLTAQASAEASVDQWVIYAAFVAAGSETGDMRGSFGTFNDSGGGLTPTWGVSFDEWASADEFGLGVDVNIKTSGIVCAANYKNWVVLGVRGGVNNIRHSKQNKPLFFAYAGQSDTDVTRGIDQTLGAFGSDDPVNIVVAGEHIFVGGGRAVYGIVGADHPQDLGNPIALPNSQGFAGRHAACAFTSDNGLAGCAYLGKDFDTIWFAWIDASFRVPTGNHALIELSKDIRGYIREEVFGGAPPANTNEVQLYADERGDCLILQYRGHKIVWRPDVDGERQWEHYEYNLDGSVWYRSVSHMDHGIRHIASTGAFDESEYDKSASFAYFTGATPDNGKEMPSTGRFWQSADVGGEAMRPFRVWLEKSNKDDEYEVDLIDHDGAVLETVFVDAGTEYATFSPDVGSRSRKYRIRSASGAGKVYQGEIEETYAPRQMT